MRKRTRCTSCCKSTDAYIGAHTINHPVVGVASLSVDIELALIVRIACAQSYSRRKVNQRLKAPAIQWQILGEVAIHDGAYRCGFGVHQRSSALNRYPLGNRAN